MSDYIKRGDAFELIDKCVSHTSPKAEAIDFDFRHGEINGLNWACDIIEAMPSADVAPVRHGHWQITDAYPHNVYCSECHTKYAQTHWAVWDDGSLPRRFCPNCGARMDAKE